jgi:hypothetical protein
MLSTVAVEVPQRRVPVNGDTVAQEEARWFRRYRETSEIDAHGTSLPRTGEIAADLPRTAPHRGTERWS